MYGEPSERDITLMQAGANYYDAFDAWITSTNKNSLTESNPALVKLAGELEYLRIERDKANGVIPEGEPNGSG